VKLEKVRIHEFQSITDSNEFDVTDITCLVGKNESGKTAILKALYRLNPVIPAHGSFDVTDDYPRSNVEDYRRDIASGVRKPAVVTKAEFRLSPDEVAEVENAFGPCIISEARLILEKGYDNVVRPTLFLDESVAVKRFVAEAQVSSDIESVLNSARNLTELRSAADELDIPDRDNRLKRLYSLLERAEKGLGAHIYEQYIKKHVPKFLYFDEYYLMSGQENINALRSRQDQGKLKESDYPLLGLIDLARLKLDELLAPGRTEALVNNLEGAGNYLTKKILKYWSQNKHLSLKFDVRQALPQDPPDMRTGTNLWVRVYDSKHMVSTPFGSRSRGFVWFFSFLAWFDQQQRQNQPLVLLLDEPGLFLHGRAQEDLLRYLEEELKPGYQVIYTTHSPFMVDPRRFDRVRIVQDEQLDTEEELPPERQGTRVITDVLLATDDSLFPLQGALGYEIHQTLFIGPNSLVVEGASDLLVLQGMSAILESRGREGLSSSWTVTPVGGASRVPAFVALLGSQRGIRVAALLDIQDRDQQSVESLYKQKLLRKKDVVTFSQFTGKKQSDIEDMFTPEFYLDLVNAEFKKDLDAPVSLSSLNPHEPRITAQLCEYFRDHPMRGNVRFNHYRPARYLVENTATLAEKVPPETLDRFESLFKTLNDMLTEKKRAES